jgi:hypothetical protein
MTFPPCPPSLSVTGTLAGVVGALRTTLEAEARFTWEAPEAHLVLTPDGRLDAGAEYEPSPLEVDGFRALVTRYNDAFPRAFGLLSSLSDATASAVWSELYAGHPREGRVRVVERHGAGGAASAVCGVYPAGYPTEYTVGSVAEAVLAGFARVSGVGRSVTLAYDAGPSALRIVVPLPLFDVVVTASDVYGEPAPSVEVVGRDGRNYGQPVSANVGPARRRRPGTGGASTSEGVIAKIQAAGAWFDAARKGPTARR